MQPELIEVDLSMTTLKGGPGLGPGPTYLCLIDGRFHCGEFRSTGYGLQLYSLFGTAYQYDPPGTNFSAWQRVWLIDKAALVAGVEETEFAQVRRQYAIDNRMTDSCNRVFTESASLARFLYSHNIGEPEPTANDEDFQYV